MSNDYEVNGWRLLGTGVLKEVLLTVVGTELVFKALREENRILASDWAVWLGHGLHSGMRLETLL